MRRILITNDDGIGAEGLLRLAEAAKRFGEVWAVAPDTERSAASHSITLHDHLDVYPHDFPVPGVRAYTCSGMPADCIRVGVLNIMPGKPDVVLSGVNYGYNLATDTQYSATVGAAMEAAFQGIHAIALSEAAHPNHDAADTFLSDVLGTLLDDRLGYGEIYNVNFPGISRGRCRGILRDRTVSHGVMYRDRYNVVKNLPGGGVRLMVEGRYGEDAEPGTDFQAVLDGYVSVGVVRNIG